MNNIIINSVFLIISVNAPNFRSRDKLASILTSKTDDPLKLKKRFISQKIVPKLLPRGDKIQ